jgi:predicted nucleotidyltransferase
MYPNQAIIDELIRRVVAAVHPLRIILFGSAARGDMRPDSDIDVLIVMPETVHRCRTAQDVHEQLFGFPVPAGERPQGEEIILGHGGVRIEGACKRPILYTSP